jgi:hypothetical protein
LRLPPDRRASPPRARRGRKGGCWAAGSLAVWRPLGTWSSGDERSQLAATPPCPLACHTKAVERIAGGQLATSGRPFVRFRDNSGRVEAVKVQRLTGHDSGVHKCPKTVIRARALSRPGQWHSSSALGARRLGSLREGRAMPQDLGARYGDAGWSSPVARQAHNLKVVGSNPTPATNFFFVQSK